MKLNKYFDSKYIFRIANLKDTKNIMNFLKDNWEPRNHILGSDVKFFLYEFQNNSNLNFIVAIEKKTKKLRAIQGFIAYSENIYNSHICASITCTDKQRSIPLLGIETMARMINILRPKSYCGIGTNFKTMLPLVKKFFNRYTGYIKHYYLINKNIKKYQLAQIKKKIKLKNNNIFYKNNINFNEIFDFNDLEKKFIFRKFKFLPYKSKFYIRKRYFEHPIYKYRFFSIKNKNTKIISLLILRNFTYDKIKIIRIVDFIGEINDLHIINNISKSLFQKENIEYIDFYAARLPKKINQNIKFNIIKNNDKNIIPDYFEPFENKNQKVFYETSNNKMILFKADADQDRPRIK